MSNALEGGRHVDEHAVAGKGQRIVEAQRLAEVLDGEIKTNLNIVVLTVILHNDSVLLTLHDLLPWSSLLCLEAQGT